MMNPPMLFVIFPKFYPSIPRVYMDHFGKPWCCHLYIKRNIEAGKKNEIFNCKYSLTACNYANEGACPGHVSAALCAFVV